MTRRTWLTAWPGLAGIALRGGWTDLAVAVAFALALQLALVTTFVWPQLLSRELPTWGAPLAAWVLVLWFWVAGCKGASRLLARESAKSLQPDEVSETMLAEAQTEYLKGHWLEAKSLLLRLLAHRPGDAEARLLLVSVYRRSGETELAEQQLLELATMPAAVRWREEMEQERVRLDRPATPLAVEKDLPASVPESTARAA